MALARRRRREVVLAAAAYAPQVWPPVSLVAHTHGLCQSVR